MNSFVPAKQLVQPPGQFAAIRAVMCREFRAALVNRYVQVFCGLALAGGIASITMAEEQEAAAVILLQIALYFVSMFSTLIGVSSARAESEEWPMLCAQPDSRPACVIGKFISLFVVLAGVLGVLFAPAMLWAPGLAALWQLYFESLAIGAVFGSLGLCAGFVAADRVQGLISGFSAWLLLLVGIDGAALLLAQWPLVQAWQDVWAALLMLNPLDALRIQALFALEQIPPEAADQTWLAHWWLTHAGLWLAILTMMWVALLLAATMRHFRRMEI